MDKNRKILIGAIGAAVVVVGAALGFVLSRTPESADLSTIHVESTQAETTEASTQAAETPVQTQAAVTDSSSSVSAGIATYTSGNIRIEYPVVDKMDDEDLEEQINDLLKSNALSVIDGLGIDESTDSLTVTCEVVSIDRKRLTAVYTGSYKKDGDEDNTNLFYTNTMNLVQAQDMGLDDYTDAYTMAGYVLSDDVKFSGLGGSAQREVLEYRSELTLSGLTAIFSGADFPLSSDGTWPESFSYESQGTIIFSMPLPHELGDYCLIAFDPTTK